MGVSRNRILIGTYIIVITFIFLYLLFPADTVRAYLSYQLSQIHPAVKVEIERVNPAFPPGLKLDNVSFYQGHTRLGKLETVRLRPGFFSLFSSETRLSFSGTGYSGNLAGNATIVSNSEITRTTVTAEISGFDLKEMAAVETLSRYKIAGRLNGTFTFSSDTANQTLESMLTLLDGEFDPASPMFEGGLLTFRQIKADLRLDNQRLAIKKCGLEGDQVDGELSGSIILNANSAKSILNLNVIIKPHQAFLAKMGKSFPVDLFKAQRGDKRGFSFKITGTGDSPRLLFE